MCPVAFIAPLVLGLFVLALVVESGSGAEAFAAQRVRGEELAEEELAVLERRSASDRSPPLLTEEYNKPETTVIRPPQLPRVTSLAEPKTGSAQIQRAREMTSAAVLVLLGGVVTSPLWAPKGTKEERKEEGNKKEAEIPCCNADTCFPC